MTSSWVPMIALAALALLPACDGAATPGPRATVFAAASLTAAFGALATAFERDHPGTAVALHFAGTQQLVLQLREGAPADVFAAADLESMQRVVATGRVRGAPQSFATNRLCIVTPPGNPGGVRTLADLARDGLVVLLCGPEVPAGRYARLALQRAGVDVRSRSDEPSVKAVVSKVALGEADAGVVYDTDARAAGSQVERVPIAAPADVVAVYQIACVDGGGDAATAAAFAAFATSTAGRSVLRRFGFEAP